MDVFYEMFIDLPRQGPGNKKYTIQALSLIKNLTSNPKILDVGCGSGYQTFTLANKLTNCEITSVDNFQPFLDRINQNIVSQNLHDKIKTSNQSMFALDFPEESFDLIWAEGSIYIIGFDRGLKEWSKFLKNNGYIVVSEISYLSKNIPDDVKHFWFREYPTMKTLEENLEIVHRAGYYDVEYFIMGKEGWFNEYYIPLENKINKMKLKYQENKEAMEILNLTQYEIDLYKKYSKYYSYVFYIGRKN
ncbi:MAG: hypothetical protein A2086_12630 [Spirochaetes bacterium GWD1_27_9]|nr:MAG: hypothetical protein A2Z98_10820 [Spirochaetes bacterium GWB1_27_13]OHD27443.1 MAG: hypothetical protein A2Y34_16275 [Spirochaetes bacterium GWC1_27_15]OHD44304.1 MAG: hypothetical protein A2086_12630 [Spirochaetes bacterium GWD1_27_9]